MNCTSMTKLLAAALVLSACSEADRIVAPNDATPARVMDVLPNGSAAGAVITGPNTIECGQDATYNVAVTGSSEAQPLDIVVVLDASGSIGSSNFTTARNATVQFANQIRASATGNHFGMVSFSTGASIRYKFSDVQDTAHVNAAIRNTPYTQGSTYTKAAMDSTIRLFQSSAARPGAQRVAVLITDGVPNPASTQNPCGLATTLASLGVKVIIVAVGNFNAAPITCLVSNPATDIVTAADFDELANSLQAAVANLPIAKSVQFNTTVAAGYTIVSATSATGSVSVDNATGVVTWTIGDLGSVTRNMSVVVRATAPAPSPWVMLNSELHFTSTAGGVQMRALPRTELTVVGCDSTPPTVTPVVSGTLGDNGWYVSDIAVSWTVVDDESPFNIISGCTISSVTIDTPSADFACAASSAGGTASGSVNVKRDATPPVISFTGNAGSYPLTASINIACAASDALSGIATSACPSASGAAWTFGSGAHALNASATDKAGNSSTANTSFTVTVDAASLCTLATQWATRQGIGNSLCAKLDAGSWNAFRNELKAQSGKAIPADKAALLSAWSSQL